MLSLLRQPLCQFLLGGALIFVVFRFAGDRATNVERTPGATEIVRPQDNNIQVSRGRVESLTAHFLARWQRPPAANELTALVTEYVREELMVREALALGLDRDDPVIRRHLRTRMEFLVQDVSAMAEPTDHDLTAFLQRHLDRFRMPTVLSFRHLFISNANRSPTAARTLAEGLLARLRGPDGPATAEESGDRFLLGDTFLDVTATQVQRDFGDAFVNSLKTAPIGQWAGPFPSTYGLHLVLVDTRIEASSPSLDAVRIIVRAEYEAERRRNALEAFQRGLLSRYNVTVEEPPAGQ